jgi:hypothetical protein
MDSYLPRVINQSESEILNSRGKISVVVVVKKQISTGFPVVWTPRKTSGNLPNIKE